MSRPFRLFLGAATIVGALAVANAADAQPEYKLRWGHYLGNSPYLAVEQEFADRVEERTDGRVEIDVAYSGGLGKGEELLNLAGRGAIDMASVVPGYYPDQLLYWKAFQIPFVFSSPEEAIEVSTASMKELPVFQEELDKMNVKFLFHQPLGEYSLTGPDPECDTVEALSGKKVRSFGADIPQIHAAVGAVPLSVPVGDLYEALQRGTLDYSFLNYGNILSNRLYEVAPYTCGPVMAIAGHLVVIGKRTWDRLPPDIQQIILEEAERAQQRYVESVAAAEEQARKDIEAAGGTVKPFPPEELAQWKEMAPDLLESWVESMRARGEGERAAEVAQRWREMTAN